jgi:NAD(P)-dependent dehydrogenase (short-subunit alcohol dehydrogenase family)
MKRVLITGSGTGFGQEVAMRLAEKGFDVVAAVEIYAQVQTLKRQAAARNVTLQVEKLDVTDPGGRRKALDWNVEILVNNAGVLEGGSVLDIPAANMCNEFEVNVIGPKSMLDETKQLIDAPWTKKVRDGLGTRPASLQKSYEMKPETPVAE